MGLVCAYAFRVFDDELFIGFCFLEIDLDGGTRSRVAVVGFVIEGIIGAINILRVGGIFRRHDFGIFVDGADVEAEFIAEVIGAIGTGHILFGIASIEAGASGLWLVERRIANGAVVVDDVAIGGLASEGSGFGAEGIDGFADTLTDEAENGTEIGVIAVSICATDDVFACA